MFKKLFTLVLFALLAVPLVTQAQEELTVAEGTTSNSYVPFEGYNADAAQHNQVLYPADMLSEMSGGEITQMVFYIDQSANNGNNTAADRLGTWTVSLGETDATTLSGLITDVELTQVYEGYFDCSTGTLTLEFDAAYTYNGGNLLIDINHAAASWNRWYFFGETAEGASYTYNSQRNFLPQTTFTYTPGGGEQGPTCAKVTGVTVNCFHRGQLFHPRRRSPHPRHHLHFWHFQNRCRLQQRC